MKILKRLFVILPLRVAWLAMTITLLMPLFYWIITGRDLAYEFWNYINKLEED